MPNDGGEDGGRHGQSCVGPEWPRPQSFAPPLTLALAFYHLMSPSDPVLAGVKAFLGWTALSACCFLIASGLACYVASAPGKTYALRLVFMMLLLLLWWLLVPLTVTAFIGNGWCRPA